MQDENKKDLVKVLVVTQGDAEIGAEGYMKVAGEKVVAFYLDGWGKTGAAYPIASSRAVIVDGKAFNFPALTLGNGVEDSEHTEICFPEYEGWSVHCVRGGKVMSICLVNN